MTEHELLIATRRDLHRHPEIGFEERRTAGIVAERLAAAGYELRTGVAVTGVVGTLRGGRGAGPTLLLRADMDALPIQEQASHAYASATPGRMHACGHDAHVAVGLAVAERLARRRDDFAGEVRYVFQPAEEGMGGARRMVEEGVLGGVDAAIGLHVWLPMPKGTVGLVDGPQMAGSQEFRITVEGRGGHGAMPHDTIDSVLVASHIVVALQSIVARNVAPMDAAVVSVGSVRAGDAMNVIAANAVLEGTIRAFRTDLQDLLRERITAVAEGVAAGLGARARVDFSTLLFPPTVNDPELAKFVRGVAAEVVGEENVRSGREVRTMAAEDFAEFATRVPGCFFFLGGSDAAAGIDHPHHSPHFDIAEEVLPHGVEILERAAIAYLNGRS
ncbi:MAG TPA: amidohydrolase [Candidatus Limnocylindrales bacterium]|nr:amidohydrolase [Candidatus Limnocylindrales bacterium]